MSKNTAIKEGGMARMFGPVRKIKTALQAGGSCLWVPKAELTLTTKSINQNGTYAAAVDGCRGYSSVTVNVPPGGTAIGKDSDGKIKSVSVDGSGNIVYETIPESIAVTTLPNTTIYQIGDTLVFTGIVVHAYDSTGEDMGAVPFGELIFPVTKAPLNIEATSGMATSDATPGGFYYTPTDSVDIYDNGSYYRTSEFPYSASYGKVICNGDITTIDGYDYALLHYLGASAVQGYESYTYNGLTVYYVTYQISMPGSASGHKLTFSPSVESTDKEYYYEYNGHTFTGYGQMAWSLIYGDIYTGGSSYEVPVKWKRTYDGQLLETSFNIFVMSVDGGGGQAGDNGTGRND